jgi:hypothetical protein
MVDCVADRLDGLIDIDDGSFAYSFRVCGPDSNYVYGAIVNLSNYCSHFGRTDVQTHNDVIAAQPVAPPAFRLAPHDRPRTLLYLFHTDYNFPLFSTFFCHSGEAANLSNLPIRAALRWNSSL